MWNFPMNLEMVARFTSKCFLHKKLLKAPENMCQTSRLNLRQYEIRIYPPADIEMKVEKDSERMASLQPW